MPPSRYLSIARHPGLQPLRRAAHLLGAGAAVAGLGGCTAVLDSTRWTNVFMPYRVEVVQGNVVTAEQIVRVTEGMSRTQVREALGTPLLTDIFHADRWDYIFVLNRQGQPLVRHEVKVFFSGDKVQRVEAPPLPTDAEFINSINPFRTAREVPVLALTPEQIKALPLPAPAAAAAAASAPTGPQRSYPPLEPRA